MKTYGAFETIEKIGQGGMGVVYKARDVRLGRVVALKVLPNAMLGDPVARTRHHREAVAAATLNHPNVATVFEIGEGPDGPFIAMEFVEGLTLREILDTGGVPPAILLAWGSQVCDALAAAHAAGIVHRDVKPENIMITTDHRAKVLDFGVARRIGMVPGRDEHRLTHDGGMVGTVHYQSPELLEGIEAGPEADVFALGAILYEMTTGRAPFDGKTTFAILHSIVNDIPARPSVHNPDIHEALEDVILRALEKNPADRYGDATEMLVKLRPVLGTPGRETHAATPERVRHNLPAQVSRFVGRQDELAQLVQLGAQSRLVTITGPGGSGKTRLSQELVRGRIDEFPGGVWLIELSPLNTAEEIAEKIAQTLGVRIGSAGAALEEVCAGLSSVAALLVLDNCEHLVDEAAKVASALLTRCPALQLIATSQERLNAAGEAVWRIPPMGVPGDKVGFADVAGYEAVQLFVDRAGQAKAGFGLTHENAPVIARICNRLDGIPLALELAAARVSVLTPDQILSRLEDRFRLLKTGSRSAEPRQQTLQATVEWSVDLLTEPERRLFYRLSSFTGGMSLEAVEGVCGDDGDEDILDLLARLVDKSLVITREADGAELRYELYQTLRAYGQIGLAEERPRVAARHAAFFLHQASKARPNLTGPDQQIWLARLGTDAANYRAALEFFLGIGDGARAAELAAALWRFWFIRGHLSEGRRLLSATLDGVRPLEWSPLDDLGEDVAEVHFGAGVLANDQGDYGAAAEHFEVSLEAHRARGDQAGIAKTLNSLGVAARDQGRYETARGLLEQGLQINRELDDGAGVAASLHALGITAHRQGDCPTARTLFEEGLDIRTRLGDKRGIAALQAHIGSVAYDEGAMETAEANLDEALEGFRGLGNKRGSVFARIHLGSVALKTGRKDLARDHFTACLKTSRDLGDQQQLAASLERFALLFAAEGKLEQAGELDSASEQIRLAIGSPRPLLDAKELGQAVPKLVVATVSGSDGILAVTRAIKLALEG
ncbi:MAG: protein kinase domain-containing protein [Longimicrobiales bacterium]